MTEILRELQEIFANPLAAFFLILNVCLLEILLSIDNAAVLATMVKDLPADKQKKALKYGIIGAYVFRGVALLFAALLVQIWWLKPIGGAYLMWMTFNYFKEKAAKDNGSTNDEDTDGQPNKTDNWLYKITVGSLGVFWSTVVMVEVMDIVFSIDNIFAVVAFSNNIILIIFGVFVGILAMRFVAMRFVKLMEKFPFLETCAFVVIGILGLKLFSAILVHYVPTFTWIEGEKFDLAMSGVTLLIFVIPILWHKFVKKSEAVPA